MTSKIALNRRNAEISAEGCPKKRAPFLFQPFSLQIEMNLNSGTLELYKLKKHAVIHMVHD